MRNKVAFSSAFYAARLSDPLCKLNGKSRYLWRSIKFSWVVVVAYWSQDWGLTGLGISFIFEKRMGIIKLGLFFFYWSIPATLLFIFVFSTRHNSNINWWKCRWCAWDSNPGQQDWRHRRIHWAMAATAKTRINYYHYTNNNRTFYVMPRRCVTANDNERAAVLQIDNERKDDLRYWN